MAFNINQFNANINRSGGIAHKSQFVGIVTPPAALTGADTGVSPSHLSFRLETFAFPSRSIQQIEYNDYGPPRMIGGKANFSEVSSSVLLSADFREREYFMRWQDIIVGQHRSVRSNNNADARRNRFDIGYFDDYMRDASVEILQYNSTSSNLDDYVYRVQLHEVYPSIIGDIDTSWASGDEIQKLNLTWVYRYFTEDFRRLDGVSKTAGEDGFFNTDFGRTVAAGADVIIGAGIEEVIPSAFGTASGVSF